ncbi:DNA-directed RNA polymerase subunit alpha, partial [Patescibacteria group bacterium]|nr:DNA-directed RNA polymerase subunit alpha [Patescibacteria group bacterium]
MIPLPQQPKIIFEEKNRGVYEIEGLYPGYGMTIGNSLRRVLLSSLEGAVITSFKLEGVNHEFSTLPGVLEDMVDLSLNLKQVRFRTHGDGPFSAKLSVKGEKEVTAADIVVPSQIEVVNPEAHIATLTDKKASIIAEFEIERGRGYQASQDRRKEKVDIGMVALDASFSPVRSVNYEVEHMRVGDRTDYNLLRLHIQTDGSVSPRDALQKASHILSEQFSVLSGVFQEKGQEAVVSAKSRVEAREE